MLRRLSCFLSAFAVLFFCSVPAFATGMEIGGAGVGIPIVGNINLDVVDFMDYCRDDLRWCGNFALNFLNEEVCPYAPQLGGGHNFIPRRTLKDGQVGLYYVCEYCGKAYGEALEEAYQEYVETLPGTTYNSDGSFLWKPGVADFVSPAVARVSGYYQVSGYNFDGLSVNLSESFPSASDSGQASLFSYTWSALAYIGDCVHCSFCHSPYTSHEACYFAISWSSVRAPFDGIYGGMAYKAGTTFSVSSAGGRKYVSAYSGAFDFPWPVVRVDSYTGGSGGNTYDIATRVSGSVSDGGSFGYVQDGQLYQSTVGTIYNETTNVYQNPVTGDTSNISKWNYDYSDRSYHLTTETGDSVTVAYGDSSVTINEGGTTYNVYYLMEETADVQEALESYCDHDYASTVTTAPTCAASGVRTYACSKCGASYMESIPPTGHNYASAVTMAPTCLNTGIRTFTCSNCGDSYTVSLPATGHVWEVVRTVPTTYDNDTGQLVQQGYTLYECSVCHEQYRIDADSGGSSLPAPSSGGVSTGTGLSVEIDSGVGRGFLATIAHGLTEDLPEVLQAASEWFTTFPQFYSSFMTFVKDGIVGCLPDVPRLMVGFGFGMTTFIGIVRKIIGR